MVQLVGSTREFIGLPFEANTTMLVSDISDLLIYSRRSALFKELAESADLYFWGIVTYLTAAMVVARRSALIHVFIELW